MLKAIKFDIESYKEKLSKMSEGELKMEWEKVTSPIKECYYNKSKVEDDKKQFSSSGVRF